MYMVQKRSHLRAKNFLIRSPFRSATSTSWFYVKYIVYKTKYKLNLGRILSSKFTVTERRFYLNEIFIKPENPCSCSIFSLLTNQQTTHTNKWSRERIQHVSGCGLDLLTGESQTFETLLQRREEQERLWVGLIVNTIRHVSLREHEFKWMVG